MTCNNDCENCPFPDCIKPTSRMAGEKEYKTSEKRREQARANYQRNRANRIQNARAYYQSHKQEYKEYHRKYNSIIGMAKQKEWVDKNRARVNERRRIRMAQKRLDPEFARREKERRKQYLIDHPEQKKKENARSTARKNARYNSDPEYRAKIQAYSREYYHKRKKVNNGLLPSVREGNP